MGKEFFRRFTDHVSLPGLDSGGGDAADQPASAELSQGRTVSRAGRPSACRVKRYIGGQNQLPREMWSDVPFLCCGRRLRQKRQSKETGCWTLLQIADTEYYEVDSTTHEIILSFWSDAVGGCFRFADGKYKIETAVKEPTVIYLERPLKVASHTIHIEVPPNPFWASIGLSVTPLPLGSG